MSLQPMRQRAPVIHYTVPGIEVTAPRGTLVLLALVVAAGFFAVKGKGALAAGAGLGAVGWWWWTNRKGSE